MRTGTLDDEIEMVTASAITTGEEVFNTYGATLSNAQLLARYGFALDGNEHDCVTWSLSDLYSVFGVSAEDARTLGGIFTMLLSRWPGADCWDASDTVYNDRGAVGDVYTSRAGAPCLAVEADGRVSHGLWAWAACRALVARGIDTPRVVELASAMSEAHVRIEELASAMDDDPKETDHTAQPSEVDQYVLDVCGTIVECVRARKEWVSRGNSMGKLGAMIDVSRACAGGMLACSSFFASGPHGRVSTHSDGTYASRRGDLAAGGVRGALHPARRLHRELVRVCVNTEGP
jgi:hypothetical protein